MAPMKTRVEKDDHIPKRVRYESQMKNEGVILEPVDFTRWKSRLNKLKQVVRQSQPNDLVIQEQTFTLTKRRNGAPDSNTQSNQKQQVEEQVVAAAEEDRAEKALAGQEMKSADPPQEKNESAADQEEKDHPSPIEELAERSEISVILQNELLSQNLRQASKIENQRLVTQDSCLGYVYSRLVEDGEVGQSAKYGSRLGIDNRVDLRTDSRQKARPPVSSNLESLLTHPKKTYDKLGAHIGYEGIKYPMSAFETALERQRLGLRSASILSPSVRPSGKESQLSGGEVFSQRSSIPPSEARAAQVELLMERGLTPKLSGTASQVMGWNTGQQSLNNYPQTTTATVQSKKRVGGATFFKNAARMESSTPNLRLPQTSLSQLKTSINAESNKKKRTIAQTKEEKMRKKYGGIKRVGQFANSELANYPPLQLSNLNMLISNLGKTGDIQQANERAIKATQRCKMRRLSRQQKSLATRTVPQQSLASELKKTMLGYRSLKHEDVDNGKPTYVTDDKGNLLHLSKSAIFDLYQDQNYNRMMPKLTSTSGMGAASLSSERDIFLVSQASIDSPVDPNRKTRKNRRSPRRQRKPKKDAPISFINFTIGSPFNDRLNTCKKEIHHVSNRQPIDLRQCNNSGNNPRAIIQHRFASQCNQQAVGRGLSQPPLMQTQERNVSYHYLSQQRLANQHDIPYDKLGSSKTGMQFDPQHMIITGGHASHAKKKVSRREESNKQSAGKFEMSLQSNQDLTMLDPGFTLASPSASKKNKESQQTLHVGSNFATKPVATNTTFAEQMMIHKVPKTSHMNDNFAIQWQVLSQNQQEMVLADYGQSQQSYREIANPPIEIVTVRSDSQRRSTNRKSHEGKSAESGRDNLTRIIQNTKDQLLSGTQHSQHQQRGSSQGQGTTYNQVIIGRSINPDIKTRDASMQCFSGGKQQHTASSQEEQNLAPIGIDNYRKTQQISCSHKIPIVIQQSSTPQDDYQSQSPQSALFGPTNQIQNKLLFDNGVGDVKGQQILHSSAALQLMQQDDEDAQSMQDIVTFLGDTTQSFIGVTEGRSHIVKQMTSETMKLEMHSSSKDDGMGSQVHHQIGIPVSCQSNERSQNTEVNEAAFISHADSFGLQKEHDVKIEIGQKKSPIRSTTLLADSRRTTINKLQSDVDLQQRGPIVGTCCQCSIELKGSMLESEYVSQLGTKRNNAIQTLGSSEENKCKTCPMHVIGGGSKEDMLQNANYPQQSMRATMHSPMKALIIANNGESADVDVMMAAVKPLNLNPSIIVNVEQSRVQQLNPSQSFGITSKKQQQNKISPRPQKTNYPATNVASKQNKRATTSMQRQFTEQRNQMLKEIKNKNSTLSQVYMQPDSQQQQFSFAPDAAVNQHSFLPKMFHNANFARTQKAIKQIREGPSRKRQREEEQAMGHFQPMSEYLQANNGGMLAPGEPHQQQTEESTENIPFLAGSALQGIVKDCKLNTTVSGSIPKRICVKQEEVNSEDRDSCPQRSSPKVNTVRMHDSGFTTRTNQMYQMDNERKNDLVTPLSDLAENAPPPQPQKKSHHSELLLVGQRSAVVQLPFRPTIGSYQFSQKTKAATNRLKKQDSFKDSLQQTQHLVGWKGLSDGRSTDDEAFSPYLRMGRDFSLKSENAHTRKLQRSIGKQNRAQQPINLESKEKQLREGQSIEIKNGSVKLLQPDEDKSKDAPALPVEQKLGTGSITITRKAPNGINIDGLCDESKKVAAKGGGQDHNYSLQVRKIDQVDGNDNDSRQQRQVIVHKLTPLATPQNNTLDEKNQQNYAGLQSQPNSPFERERFLSATGMEFTRLGPVKTANQLQEHVSNTEQGSNLFRKTGDTINDHQNPISSDAQALESAQKGSQSRQNIINLWAIPSQNSNIQSQANQTQVSYQAALNVVINHNTTASKQINQAENKARQFIERQRKRTATLGAQRHHRYQYNPIRAKQMELTSCRSKSRSPSQIGADLEEKLADKKDQVQEQKSANNADQSMTETTNIQQTSKHLKPAVVDFNGDTLYESGLLISRAPLVENQQKHVHNPQVQAANRKGLLGQALSKGKKYNSTQPQKSLAATYLASNYSQTSKDMQTMVGQVVIADRPLPEVPSQSQQPQVQMSLHQKHASLTRINHQVLNANPRLLAPAKSPKRFKQNQDLLPFDNSTGNPNTQKNQLMLQGNVMLSDNSRMYNSDGLIDPESQKYRDLLHDARDVVDSSSTVRAFTPTLDNWQKQQKMHETRQTVQIWSKRSCGSRNRNSKNSNSDIMTGPKSPSESKQ